MVLYRVNIIIDIWSVKVIVTKWREKVRDIWSDLRGGTEWFSLQSRIYHSVCIITIIIMFYVMVFNFANGLIAAGMLTCVAIPTQAFLFYLSRYKRKTTISFVLYALVVNTFFIFNYRFNGGISGPTLLSFLSVYFLSIAIAEKRHYWIWTLTHCAIVATLLIVEYAVPGFVVTTYDNKLQRAVDWGSTYIVTIVLLLACITYIVSNYQREHEKVEHWASELHKLNDEKSRLLQLISHDYQTPLLAIKQYLDMLRRYDMDDDVRMRLEGELGRILIDTQNLLLNLLEYNRIGPLKQEEAQYCAVTELLEPILRVYRAIAASKNINLIDTIATDIHVLCNPSSFSTLFRNLINNAVKHTETGGWIKLFYMKENESQIFVVANSSILEDLTLQDKINSFLQGNSREFSSIGIRLIRQHAEILGAEISCSSSEDEGTCFVVTFK